MITNSKNKQITKASNKGDRDLSARDTFIVEKAKKGFTPNIWAVS